MKYLLIVFFSLIILGCLVYLSLPVIPEVIYRVSPPPNTIDYAVSNDTLLDLNVEKSGAEKPLPKENRLVIPKIGVDAEILEGPDLSVLGKKEGVWREPLTDTPDVPGNMVLAGHRFQYLPPNTVTFYNLDKLQKNDKIIIFWKQRQYLYTIKRVYEVLPTETEVLDPSPDSPYVITLYTCTPLGTRQKRLIVEAILEV